jgi:hypothetical protein
MKPGILLLVALGPAALGTTPGAVCLKLDAGVRQAAMGSAACALADDALAAQANPAALARLKQDELAVSHNAWIAGINHEHVRAAWHMPVGVLGARVDYLGYGWIPEYDASGFYLGDYLAYDMVTGAGYAVAPHEAVSVGLNVNGLMQRIDDRTAFGYAIDLGVHWRPVSWFDAAVAATNLGPAIRFVSTSAPMPVTARVGCCWHLIGNHVRVVAELDHTAGQNFSGGAGAELCFAIFQLRAGYRTGAGNAVEGVSFGGGLDFEGVRFDYALLPSTLFGQTHRFGVLMRF